MLQFLYCVSPPQNWAHQGPSSPAMAGVAAPIPISAHAPRAITNRIVNLLELPKTREDSGTRTLFPPGTALHLAIVSYSIRRGPFSSSNTLISGGLPLN